MGNQGPQGLRGIQGEAGERGKQGESGKQGTQGIRGETGESGQRGEQGPIGIGISSTIYDENTGNLRFVYTNNTSVGPFNIRGSPGDVIQTISYNNDTKKLYFNISQGSRSETTKQISTTFDPPQGPKGDTGRGISTLDFNEEGLIVNYDGGQSQQQIAFWEKLSENQKINNWLSENTIKCDGNSGCSTDKNLSVNNRLLVNGSFQAIAPSGTQTITGGSINLNTQNLSINDNFIDITKLLNDYKKQNTDTGSYSIG